MKKPATTAEQPIGIVIAMGKSAPVAPRVRAYFWFEALPPATEDADQ